MKRNVLVLFTIASLYLPVQVFAISGTCSWHGGVDCSYGSDWDWSVVCNDGWKDSSEMYYDTNECTQKLHRCTSGEYNKLSTKYDLDNQSAVLSSLGDKIKQVDVMSSSSHDDIVKNYLETSKIYQQWLPLNAKYKNDFYTTKKECYAIGDESYYKTLAENTRKQADMLYSTQNNTQPVVVPTIIEGGYIRGSELFCDNGYNKDTLNLKCVRDNSVATCSQSSNSQGVNTMSCTCSVGYRWAGGVTCKKYNIQTGEFIEGVSTTTQPTVIKTSSINNINIPSFTRTLKKGMGGDDVKQLQVLLQKLNYLPSTHVPSNSFGPITNNALIKFQKDNKIVPATGSFGPATQAKLISLSKDGTGINTQSVQSTNTVSSQTSTATKTSSDSIYDDNIKYDKLGRKILITQEPNYKLTNVVKARIEILNGLGADGWFYKDTKTFMTDTDLNEQAKKTQTEVDKLNNR